MFSQTRYMQKLGTAPSVPKSYVYIGGVGTKIPSPSELIKYLVGTLGYVFTVEDIFNFQVNSLNSISFEIHKDFGWESYFSATDNVRNELTSFHHVGETLFNSDNFGFANCFFNKVFSSNNCDFVGRGTGLQRPFVNNDGIKHINIGSSLNLGDTFNDPSKDNQLFLAISGTSWNLYLHPTLETINNGNPEADIQYAVNSAGATAVYQLNTNAPNAVVNLSASNITSNSIQLNFSSPSSVNALQTFEVWVEGGFYDYITASGQSITGLSSGTQYSIKIVACDQYYNRSDFSNEILVSTL